jgi:hypothetical protein
MATIDISGVSNERDVTYSSPDIDVLSNTLDSGSLVEVSGYDTFPFSSADSIAGTCETHLTISQSVPQDSTCIF